MIGYGDYKKRYKIHAHNTCGICSEKSGTRKSSKKRARQYSKKEIVRNLKSWECQTV